MVTSYLIEKMGGFIISPMPFKCLFLFETEAHTVAQAGLEFVRVLIFNVQDYRHGR